MKIKKETVNAILTCLREHPNGIRLRYLPCGRMEGIEILEYLAKKDIVEYLDVRHPEQMEWYYLWRLKKRG